MVARKGTLEQPFGAARDAQEPATTAPADLGPSLGENLRRLRVRRGLSLERFAQASGVSRAMLSQIELGRSTPSINVAWKIINALAVPFSALIGGRSSEEVSVVRASKGKQLSSAGGRFISRALFPFDAPRRAEFYELRLAARSEENAEPHPPGTVENLVVTTGEVEIEVSGRKEQLGPGDAIVFQADVPHAYRNQAEGDSVMYLVMTYADPVR